MLCCALGAREGRCAASGGTCVQAVAASARSVRSVPPPVPHTALGNARRPAIAASMCNPGPAGQAKPYTWPGGQYLRWGGELNSRGQQPSSTTHHRQGGCKRWWGLRRCSIAHQCSSGAGASAGAILRQPQALASEGRGVPAKVVAWARRAASQRDGGTTRRWHRVVYNEGGRRIPAWAKRCVR